jgi:hypothetical protein
MDTQMDEHTNEVPFFDETDYSAWRINMKGYLKSKGAGVWDTVVVGPVPSKNQSKFVAKKNNAVAFKTILNGLSGSVKESIGKCTSTKDLWLKLEKAYQDSVINEGKDSPGCNNSKCNDVECSPANEEEDLEVVCVESTNNYLVDEEEDLLKLKDKVIDALEEVSNEIGDDSDTFEDLERITKESLDKYQRHFMALKQFLKKQEGSETTKQRTQLEEKEEEIKRLKNEIISQSEEKKKVDDELRKILEDIKETKEINVNLKIQLEEAKRIEELLKNQVNEKEESCHKLEAEVVELRRKAEK